VSFFREVDNRELKSPFGTKWKVRRDAARKIGAPLKEISGGSEKASRGEGGF